MILSLSLVPADRCALPPALPVHTLTRPPRRSRQLAYPQATQCDGCKQVFCGCCSVADYEEREVRTFCLDCHAAGGCPVSDAGRGMQAHT